MCGVISAQRLRHHTSPLAGLVLKRARCVQASVNEGKDERAVATVVAEAADSAASSNGNGLASASGANGAASVPVLPYASNEALVKAISELREQQLKALQEHTGGHVTHARCAMPVAWAHTMEGGARTRWLAAWSHEGV